MSVLDKLETKFGRNRGINLMYVLVGAYAMGFVLEMIVPQVQGLLCFAPSLILKGQVWRLVTWMIQSGSSQFFMAMLMCFVYISMAKNLEMVIGKFRLNFFLVTGLVLTEILGFVYYFALVEGFHAMDFSFMLSPYYLFAMLFVLFAMIFPDAQFRLMFIIPIRGKYMIFITLAFYVLDIVQAFVRINPAYGWLIAFMVAAAILAVVIFMACSKYRIRRNRKAGPVNMNAYKSAHAKSQKPYRHKCTVCGCTDVTNPEREFRYCTKCSGSHEYCSEHLYTHVHIQG